MSFDRKRSAESENFEGLLKKLKLMESQKQEDSSSEKEQSEEDLDLYKRENSSSEEEQSLEEELLDLYNFGKEVLDLNKLSQKLEAAKPELSSVLKSYDLQLFDPKIEDIPNILQFTKNSYFPSSIYQEQLKRVGQKLMYGENSIKLAQGIIALKSIKTQTIVALASFFVDEIKNPNASNDDEFLNIDQEFLDIDEEFLKMEKRIVKKKNVLTKAGLEIFFIDDKQSNSTLLKELTFKLFLIMVKTNGWELASVHPGLLNDRQLKQLCNHLGFQTLRTSNRAYASHLYLPNYADLAYVLELSKRNLQLIPLLLKADLQKQNEKSELPVPHLLAYSHSLSILTADGACQNFEMLTQHGLEIIKPSAENILSFALLFLENDIYPKYILTLLAKGFYQENKEAEHQFFAIGLKNTATNLLVGAAYYYYKPETNSAYLDSICIDPNYQEKKLGSKLFFCLITHLIAIGSQRLDLSSTLKGYRLYINFNFLPTANEDNQDAVNRFMKATSPKEKYEIAKEEGLNLMYADLTDPKFLGNLAIKEISLSTGKPKEVKMNSPFLLLSNPPDVPKDEKTEVIKFSHTKK